MKCQLCDKQATVHLTEIINGEKTEKHLCEECAYDNGITIKAHVPINELITDLVESQEQASELSELTCPQCTMTWSEFRKGGLLGCPKDYEIFDEPLRKIISKAHENAKGHIGRSPLKTSGKYADQVSLFRLRQKLQHAVESEDYEIAAALRDEIEKYGVRN